MDLRAKYAMGLGELSLVHGREAEFLAADKSAVVCVMKRGLPPLRIKQS
jgi:hypothetical protein